MARVLPLRQFRLERGWTLDDVARRIAELGWEAGEDNLGVNANMVGRWERGQHRPKAPYPKLLCVLFQATASELGIIGGFQEAEPSDLATIGGFQKTQPYGTLEDVDRRDVLHLLSVALAAPVLLRGEAEADRLAYALGRPSRADHEVVSIVEAEIANVRRLDDVVGSHVAARPALAQRDVIRVLLEGGPSGPVAERLAAAGGQLCQLLGWLAQGMNDFATSRRFYGEALQLAHQAGDDGLGAYVLGQLSCVVGGGLGRLGLEVPNDALHEALAFAQAAASRSAKGSPATRSYVAGVEARVLASLGDHADAERALGRAWAAFNEFRPEDEPPWLYYFHTGEMEGQQGLVYMTLGRPEPARRAYEWTLQRRLDGAWIRDRGTTLARLAETYVPDGEVDEACRLGGEALAIATHTGNDRAVLIVRNVRGQLEPWASEPTVRELDDQLASTAAWAHPATAT